MKSVFLYVAIVAVWGAVLVPMWLRRDADNTRSGIWLLGRRLTVDEDIAVAERSATGGDIESTPPASQTESDAEVRAEPQHERGDDSVPEPEPAGYLGDAHHRRPRGRRTRSRGAVMARRRRRTLGFGCLLAASIVTVIAGVGRWWFVLPPTGLFVGHLALLRAAAQMDAARRAERRAVIEAARAEASPYVAEAVRPEPEPVSDAEVIDLTEQRSTREVYDQYVDAGLRAVGD